MDPYSLLNNNNDKEISSLNNNNNSNNSNNSVTDNTPFFQWTSLTQNEPQYCRMIQQGNVILYYINTQIHII